MGGTPKSSNGMSPYKLSIWGTPTYGNPHLWIPPYAYSTSKDESAGLPASLVDLACSWLYYLFCHCLCLDFPLGADFTSSNLNPPSPPRSSSSFFLALCWAQLCPRLSQHRLRFAHLVISMIVSVISCCVCHRFAPSLLVSSTWSTGFCAERLLLAWPF